jgi:hypothetical protein
MHTRRRFGAAVLVAALALAGTGRADAAFITWGAAANISGDTDVVTTGTLVGAFNLGDTGVPSTIVNTVPFAALAVPTNSSSPFTSGNITLAASNGSFNSFNTGAGSGSPPFSNLTLAYRTLLSGGTEPVPVQPVPTLTLTISGLTIGQQYEFEWWDNTSSTVFQPGQTTTATAGNSVTLRGNTTNQFGGTGQFAPGTFTADATSEVITFTAVAPSLEFVNGFQLRDLGPAVTAVPEPASAIPLITGALALLGYGWRRRTQAA